MHSLTVGVRAFQSLGAKFEKALKLKRFFVWPSSAPGMRIHDYEKEL